MLVLLMKSIEKILAKGEIAHHEQFLLLQQCFQVICCRCVCMWKKSQNVIMYQKCVIITWLIFVVIVVKCEIQGSFCYLF